MSSRYALGLDFGTESVRFLLAETTGGANTHSLVVDYPHGVIDRELPGGGEKLPPDWALQHPQDWIDCMKAGIPRLLKEAGVGAEEVIGIGIDFTSCTVLPVDAEGTPLCLRKEFTTERHAWPKLWKHHAAQPQADAFNELAVKLGVDWLEDYGGRISSEWMIPKALQIFQEAPSVYQRADSLMEGGDWIIRYLTGAFTRNSCAAGYKSLWAKERGFPEPEFLGRPAPEFAAFVEEKLGGEILSPGAKAGGLKAGIAGEIGLRAGTPVGAAIIDAHAGVPGAGVAAPGKMVLVVGTSTCHMLLGKKKVRVKGIAGAVTDGIIAGYCGYEAGQAGSGDILVWLVRRLLGGLLPGAGCDEDELYARLEKEALGLPPGAGGLVALDWWNGNRSVLMDADLSGLIIGLTLSTSAAQLYRAIVEATAYGTRRIITAFEDAGVKIDELYLCGGLAKKSTLLRQVYADVCGRELHLAASDHASALGAAMLGAVAAGKIGGGFDTMQEAVAALAPPGAASIKPNPKARAVYDDLYSIYLNLHNRFGIEEKTIMHRLKKHKAAQV
jgi:L-ribulokinase